MAHTVVRGLAHLDYLARAVARKNEQRNHNEANLHNNAALRVGQLRKMSQVLHSAAGVKLEVVGLGLAHQVLLLVLMLITMLDEQDHNRCGDTLLDNPLPILTLEESVQGG